MSQSGHRPALPETDDQTTSAGLDSVPAKANWLGWALAAFILASCFLFVDFTELLAGLRRLGVGEIAFLVLLATADRLLMGYKWGLLLRIVGVHLPMGRVIRIFYQSSFSGVFLPSSVGGDLLRAYWVINAVGKPHQVFASLVVERLLGLMAAVNWAVLGGTVFAIVLWPERIWTSIPLGLMAFAGLNLAFAALVTARVHAFVLRQLRRYPRSRIARQLHAFYEAYATFSTDPRRLAVVAALTLIEQLLQMLLCFGTAMALGVEVSPVAFLAASALYMVVLRIPISPDGWGIGELTAIGVYGLIGVNSGDAFAIGVAGHLIPLVALVPGFLFLLQPRPVAVPSRKARDVRPSLRP